jgi:integrase
VARLRGVGGRATKNEEPYRAVPLTSAAVAILVELKNRDGNVVKLPRGKVFRTTASAIKQSWERAVVRARDTYERETLMTGLAANGMSEKDAAAEIRKVKRSGGRTPAKPKPPHKVTLTITQNLADDPLLTDLHFHDLRHEATSRLAEKLQLHELMKVTGHKGTRMLARYYHPRAEDLARKLG